MARLNVPRLINITKSSFEIAVHEAKYAGIRLRNVTDTFEVIDILSAITCLEKPVGALCTGIDIIRWLDSTAGNNVSLCFIEKNVYCILLKFCGHEDGGLMMVMSTNVQALLDLFSQMNACVMQQKILLWLIAN